MAIDIRGMAPLLFVFDMPEAIHFYRDLLGFDVVASSGEGDDVGWVMLKMNGVEVMLNTAYDVGERPPAKDPARVAAHGDTTLYFGCQDLDGVYRDLLARGLNVKAPKVASYGMKQLYVTDPDGFGLCFQWPASEEMREQWRKRYAT